MRACLHVFVCVCLQAWQVKFKSNADNLATLTRLLTPLRLQRDPSARPTAESLLNHPFVTFKVGQTISVWSLYMEAAHCAHELYYKYIYIPYLTVLTPVPKFQKY